MDADVSCQTDTCTATYGIRNPWCFEVESARTYTFETLLCKIVLTNINKFFPTQYFYKYYWTLIYPSLSSRLISKNVGQRTLHDVTLLWLTTRRRDWWRVDDKHQIAFSGSLRFTAFVRQDKFFTAEGMCAVSSKCTVLCETGMRWCGAKVHDLRGCGRHDTQECFSSGGGHFEHLWIVTWQKKL